MKFFLLITLLALPVIQSQAASRVQLFDCAHTNTSSALERLNIYETTKGRNTYHEIDIVAYESGVERINTRKVYLQSRYDDKVLEFSTGSFRIRIDRVRPNGGYLWAFARVPDYGVHSFDWKCKEI